MSATAEIYRSPAEVKAEFLELFKNSPVAVVLCQAEGKIVAVNPALERELDLDPKGIESLRFADLIHPQDRPENAELISELLAGKRESFQFSSRTNGPNSRPVCWTAWRVEVTNGYAGVLAVVEDLPAASAAEQRLRQAERLEAVGRLAGGVAHDFNNLLTGVLLYCDLLLASMEPLHRARHYAEEIRNAGMQATGLVRQLLAVARPSSTQPLLLSLNQIAEGMRNLLVRLIGENIELQLHLDPNLGLVKMDPTQAQQILLNLVLNARDAMPRGGVISVETRNCNLEVLGDPRPGAKSKMSVPFALFVVEDNGSGMDDAARVHLFERFFTTKASQGNGLGLATVHDIVTTSGGLIDVESQLGHGTRVSVLLPIAPEIFWESCTRNNSCPARNRAPHSSYEEE